MEIMDDDSIAAAGTYYSMSDVMGKNQGCEDVDLGFIAIHGAWCSVSVVSLPTPFRSRWPATGLHLRIDRHGGQECAYSGG